MTSEDLAQLTTVFTAIVAAAEQRLTARQDRAVASIATEISQLRSEMNTRFETADRRAERLAENLRAIHTQLAGIDRWADSLDADNSKIR